MATKAVDLGYDRLIKKLKALDGHGVTVGIHEDAGDYEEGLTVAQVMAVHEFGTRDKRVPARPTLGPTFDANLEKYQRESIAASDRVAEAGISPSLALQRLALMIETDVKRAITDLRTPSLKPATIKAKGSDNPLIDTGRMRNSVEGRVTTTADQEDS